MKNVLITLVLGVINSVIQAAFEPILFNPKIENITAYNNTIKITGFTSTPFNFNSLNSNYLIAELNLKKHSFLINSNKLGGSIYSENQISFHYKAPPKFLYRSIVGINYYQILIKNYGSANLITADIGLSFHLKPNLKSAVLFQNILKLLKIGTGKLRLIILRKSIKNTAMTWVVNIIYLDLIHRLKK